MRKHVQVVLSILFVLAIVGVVCAQDAVKACGDMCKVVLENDHVRVIKYLVKPGAKVPMHSHPNAVTYFITDTDMKTMVGDKTTETKAKAGEARWSDAITHSNENVGTTTGEVIVIEIKEPAAPAKK